MSILPNRPAPHLISFDDDCFVIDGAHEEYSVARSWTAPGPKQFGTDKNAAMKYAGTVNRQVTITQRPIRRRVAWNTNPVPTDADHG